MVNEYMLTGNLQNAHYQLQHNFKMLSPIDIFYTATNSKICHLNLRSQRSRFAIGDGMILTIDALQNFLIGVNHHCKFRLYDTEAYSKTTQIKQIGKGSFKLENQIGYVKFLDSYDNKPSV